LNSIIVNILEGSHRVVRVPQIPNVQKWQLIIIIGHQELSRNFRVPDKAGLSENGLWALLLLVLTHTTPIKVVKV